MSLNEWIMLLLKLRMIKSDVRCRFLRDFVLEGWVWVLMSSGLRECSKKLEFIIVCNIYLC